MIIAVVPGFTALILVSGRNIRNWLNALIGGAGWFIALLLRAPLLVYLDRLPDINMKMLFAALAAGVYEEVFRVLIVRSRVKSSLDINAVAAIGLGWGLVEALIIYVLQVPISASLYGYNWIVFLPGAIERNAAILFHVSLSFIAALAMRYGLLKILCINISLHMCFNTIAVYTLLITRDPWLTEAIIALIALTTMTIILHHVLKRFQPPREQG